MPLRTFTDQVGNTISLTQAPQRIISLVPSQTELLAYLGLDNRVVGITRFCAHPPSWKKTKYVVGGTKNFNPEVIQSLNPDLIIGNKEENYQEGIDRLKTICPVWMSDIVTLSDAFNMITQVGQLTDTDKKTQKLLNELNGLLLNIENLPPLRTLYLIWRKPWMAAGGNTFIHELIALSGLKNCCEKNTRYPELSDQAMKELDPQLVLLSSEPYPFKEKHVHEILTILPRAKILQVNGEMFSWYGSRMLHFPEYIKSLREFLS